jgi:uncharacterized RDD family membrane protein YckC
MNDDGTIQYGDFSIAELKEALAGINRERYPLNFANLTRELAARSPATLEQDARNRLPASGSSAPDRSLRYAGFWERFGAYWLDALVLLPLAGIAYLGSEFSRLFHAVWFLPGLCIGVLFHVWLVRRFGGTPGKRLLGIRIAMVDGSPVTLRAAWIRYSVLFVLSALSSLAIVLASLKMTDAVYFSLGTLDRVTQLAAMAPSWRLAVRVAMGCWVWGEFLTMLFNERRRAVHDYLAGTVVIHDPVVELPTLVSE